MIYFIIIVNILIIFKLAWDWYAKNKKKRIINHKRSVLIDGVIYAVSSFFLFDNLLLTLGWFIIAVGYRWFAFDLIFNLINNWHWSNCGNSSIIDVKVDLLDGKDDNRCVLSLVLKFGVIALGVTLILL